MRWMWGFILRFSVKNLSQIGQKKLQEWLIDYRVLECLRINNVSYSLLSIVFGNDFNFVGSGKGSLTLFSRSRKLTSIYLSSSEQEIILTHS